MEIVWRGSSREALPSRKGQIPIPLCENLRLGVFYNSHNFILKKDQQISIVYKWHHNEFLTAPQNQILYEKFH